MKLLLKLCIYFIIFLIVYNLFILLFSNNIIESLYNFETYTEDDVINKCKEKIEKKYDKDEYLNNPRSCGHISIFWKPKTRRHCDRKRSGEQN